MRLSHVLTLLVTLAPLLPRSARADDDHARFAGTYTFAGAAAEDGARHAAIDRVVGNMFFAVRGIARSRLTNATRIEPWVSIKFDAGAIRVRVPSAAEASSPEAGNVVEYTNGEDHVKLSQKLASGRLTQVFVAEDGKRQNDLVLASDGSLLFVKVTVSSPKLPAPVVYTLTYKKRN
jgi:hypothetical protein